MNAGYDGVQREARASAGVADTAGTDIPFEARPFGQTPLRAETPQERPGERRGPFDGAYKTNFWDTVNAGAYKPLYPFDIVPPPVPVDLGLIVPDPAVACRPRPLSTTRSTGICRSR
jgi:hypothetical protein